MHKDKSRQKEERSTGLEPVTSSLPWDKSFESHRDPLLLLTI